MRLRRRPHTACLRESRCPTRQPLGGRRPQGDRREWESGPTPLLQDGAVPRPVCEAAGTVFPGDIASSPLVLTIGSTLTLSPEVFALPLQRSSAENLHFHPSKGAAETKSNPSSSPMFLNPLRVQGGCQSRDERTSAGRLPFWRREGKMTQALASDSAAASPAPGEQQSGLGPPASSAPPTRTHPPTSSNTHATARSQGASLHSAGSGLVPGASPAPCGGARFLHRVRTGRGPWLWIPRRELLSCAAEPGPAPRQAQLQETLPPPREETRGLRSGHPDTHPSEPRQSTCCHLSSFPRTSQMSLSSIPTDQESLQENMRTPFGWAAERSL